MSMLASLFSFGTGSSGLTCSECFCLSVCSVCFAVSLRTERKQQLPGNWPNVAAAAFTRRHKEVEMLLERKQTRESLVLKKNEVTGGWRKLRKEESRSFVMEGHGVWYGCVCRAWERLCVRMWTGLMRSSTGTDAGCSWQGNKRSGSLKVGEFLD